MSSFRRPQPLAQGKKRVEAIVKDKYGVLSTKHIDIPK